MRKSGVASVPSSYSCWIICPLQDALIDSLAMTSEGRCGKHWLFLPTQHLLPAFWSQHLGFSLRNDPSFVYVVSGSETPR